MAKALYKCKQHVLYIVARMGWRACLEHIEEFGAFATNYNAEFVEAQLAAIDEAERMPGNVARKSDVGSLKVALLKLNKVVCKDFRILKMFIKRAFPKSLHDSYIKAAGGVYYRAGSRENWDLVVQMLFSMVNFIALHREALRAIGWKEEFEAEFLLHKAEYIAKYEAFMDRQVSNPTLTAAKIEADNKVYRELMMMFMIAKLLRFKESERKRFNFGYLEKLVDGSRR